LEDHQPELKAEQAAVAAGEAVGAVARQLYDPTGSGELIDVGRVGQQAALQRSQALLESAQPIFEAGFAAEGAIAFADVMLPVERDGKIAWRMVEVKSATEVKDHYRDDAAIQAFVARRAGVRLESIAVAHVDSAPGSIRETATTVACWWRRTSPTRR
jgi:predicted RecB family nuclease